MAVKKVTFCLNTGFDMFLNPNFVDHFIDIPKKPKPPVVKKETGRKTTHKESVAKSAKAKDKK